MFTLEVDRREKVLLVRMAGVVTDKVLASVESAVAAFVRSEGPHRRIMDLTGVTADQIAHELLISRARNSRVTRDTTPARIHVAPTDYLFAMCRMYTTYQHWPEAPPSLVVRSLDEALAAFSLTEPDFQPVSLALAA